MRERIFIAICAASAWSTLGLSAIAVAASAAGLAIASVAASATASRVGTIQIRRLLLRASICALHRYLSISAKHGIFAPAREMVSLRKNPLCHLLDESRRVRHLVRMVRTAHQRARSDMLEAELVSVLGQGVEFGWCPVAQHGVMVRRRLQILADRHHIDIVRAQIVQRAVHLRFSLAEAEHDARLGWYLGMLRLEALQQR